MRFWYPNLVPFWKDFGRPGEVWAPLGASWGHLGTVLGRLGRQDRPRARGLRVLRPHGDRLGLHFGRVFGPFSHDFSINFVSYLESPNFNLELAG